MLSESKLKGDKANKMGMNYEREVFEMIPIQRKAESNKRIGIRSTSIQARINQVINEHEIGKIKKQVKKASMVGEYFFETQDINTQIDILIKQANSIEQHLKAMSQDFVTQNFKPDIFDFIPKIANPGQYKTLAIFQVKCSYFSKCPLQRIRQMVKQVMLVKETYNTPQFVLYTCVFNRDKQDFNNFSSIVHKSSKIDQKCQEKNCKQWYQLLKHVCIKMNIIFSIAYYQSKNDLTSKSSTSQCKESLTTSQKESLKQQLEKQAKIHEDQKKQHEEQMKGMREKIQKQENQMTGMREKIQKQENQMTGMREKIQKQNEQIEKIMDLLKKQ